MKLEGVEGQLGVIHEGGRDLPGVGIEVDLAGELDREPALLVLGDEVDRGQRAGEGVVALGGGVDGSGERVGEQRGDDLEGADLRGLRALHRVV